MHVYMSDCINIKTHDKLMMYIYYVSNLPWNYSFLDFGQKSNLSVKKFFCKIKKNNDFPSI